MLIKEITKENADLFEELYEHSAMTVQGYIPAELDLYIAHFKEKCGLHEDAIIYIFKGPVYNEYYGMKGDNKYPENFNMFSIKLSDMDNCMGAREMIRWFDDIVDNDKYYNRGAK